MTREQAITHNESVITGILLALVDNNLADPYRLITNPKYASERITTYLEAANITREMMNMPKLVIYNLDEYEE